MTIKELYRNNTKSFPEVIKDGGMAELAVEGMMLDFLYELGEIDKKPNRQKWTYVLLDYMPCLWLYMNDDDREFFMTEYIQSRKQLIN